MNDSAHNDAIAASRDAHATWREDRAAAVTGPTGNLPLVETRWLPAGEIPDTEAEQAAAGAGITVTALARTNIDTGETDARRPRVGCRIARDSRVRQDHRL